MLLYGINYCSIYPAVKFYIYKYDLIFYTKRLLVDFIILAAYLELICLRISCLIQ